MVQYRRSSRLTRRHRAVACLLILLTVVAWWGWVPVSFINPACQRTANGAWIGVEWAPQPSDPAAVAALAQQATEHHLAYLFSFTTYVKADGSFNPSFTHVPAFVATFRQHNKHTALLAWVGLPSQHVTFANTRTRSTIIAFVTSLVMTAGFDGIHINAEPLPNGDPHYLQFLAELHHALAPTHLLSVATLPWASPLKATVQPANPYRWSTRYYQAVARHVDQIVVMTYDSHTSTPALYRLWMREQVRGIQYSVRGQAVDLLVGISLSRGVATSHRPDVEDVANGLAGLCASLAQPSQDGAPVTGVALYALWEAQTTDWQIWQRWQGQE